MTPGFWISSITVAGHPTRRDSSVGFESGLNVIYGPVSYTHLTLPTRGLV